ncbi:MAG: WG repeat-containing protein [Ruminococcus sp.]|nr:WG repeat-containing protein [Ruminococcus sp.]
MKLKYKKILAQILSVAVAGSNFAVPVVCTNNPIISVNAEESEQDTHDDNEEEVTDEDYSEEDYSEEDYSEDDYSEEEYYEEDFYEDEYSEEEEYFEEDDIYETEELDIEEKSSENKIEIGVEYGGSYVQGSVSSGIPSRYMNTFIMNEDGSASFSAFSGGTVDRIDFTDSVYENGVYNLSGGSYIYGSQGVVQTNVTGTITVNDDSSISFSSSKLTMGADYLSDDNMVIIDKTTTTTTGTTTETSTTTSITTTSTETTTETTTTTTTKEPAITYEWYVEPSIKADDINTVGVFMESISHDNDDYEYNYGQFADTGYAIVKDGDFYGVIDMNGNVVIETDYVLIRGAINDHFRLYDEEGKYTYFCCETGEYLDPQEPYCAWCERTLLSDVCSSYYCYDPDRDLLAYIGVMPKNNNEEESITLNGQNSSGTTIDFPEGKTIPVRMVSIESDDEVILYDSYGIMRDGEIIVDFNYDNALSYKDGITAVEQDGEWYYYDEDGYQIIEDSCEGSYYFNINNEDYIPYLPSEEYIAFNTAWGGGYYSTDGGVVIPVGEFAEARPVFNGLAWVKDHATGLWGVIQLTGERADAPENNDDNSDSEEDGDENNSSNSSSNNSSSSSGSNGKAAPKTGDDFGNVFALLALSLGVMVVSMKRREK